MSYTERNWKDASILVCNDVDGTLDKTYAEIKEAIEKSYVVMVKKTVDDVTTFLDVHTIDVANRELKTKGWVYTANSDSDFPVGEESGDDSGGGGSGGGMKILEFTYELLDVEEEGFYSHVTMNEFKENFYKYTHILVKEEGESDLLLNIGVASMNASENHFQMRTSACIYENEPSYVFFGGWYVFYDDTRNIFVLSNEVFMVAKFNE